MRVAPRRPTVRTPPTAISAVSRDPAGSSTLHVDRLGRADPAEAGPRARDGEPLAVEVDRGLLGAAAVDRLRRVGGRHGHDRVGAVAGDDLDRADLQVDGEVDGGGGVEGGHADASLSVGVFVRPRGFAWLVDVLGVVGLGGLARPAREVVAGAQRALRGSSLLGLEGGRDRADQPGVDGQAVGRRRLVHPRLEGVRQAERGARGARVVEVDGCGRPLVAVRLGVRLGRRRTRPRGRAAAGRPSRARGRG